jgi:Holliday junction DNA helicase RuvA
MIASLTGRITHTELGTVIIDVGGVGYLVHGTGRMISALPHAPEICTLLVEMVVREDAITLYGFISAEDKQAFRLLQTVQGVGAKAALSILNTLSPQELVQAILAADKAMVSRADGIGPKIALRIVNELAQKVGAISAAMTGTISDVGAGSATLSGDTSGTAATASVLAQDALSALVNLGYSRSEAFYAVSASLAEAPGLDLPALIQHALKKMGRD